MIRPESTLDINYNEEDELMHFGIKGMHWGVRRYQNEDGTLTSAGKKHYSKGKQRAKRRELKYEQMYKTNRLSLTDQDLDRRITRMNKEKRYMQLVKETETSANSKKYTEQQLKRIGGIAIGTASTAAITALGKKLWPIIKKLITKK